jgi:GNAT superfamily N-acetyltransferase
MREVPRSRFASYIEEFIDPQADLVLASIAAGNTKGHLWESPQAGSPALLLWDQGNNVFYLAGELEEDSIKTFQHLVASRIKPAALTSDLARFKVRALSGAWEQAILRLFSDISPEPLIKVLYLFNAPSVAAIPAVTLNEVTYSLIDAALLNRTDLKNLEIVRDEVEWMWPSLERFYEYGFGAAALLKDEIICWCTAEYVSKGACGIGIETLRAYQNKGVATATAAHFVDHCLRRNINPYWECWRDNIGSVRVAEKVGFEKIQEAPFWSGVFK